MRSWPGLGVCALLLCGCATPPGEPPTLDTVLIEQGRADLTGAGAETARIDSARAAARLAVANNPSLQSAAASLGFAVVDVAEARGIRPPSLSWARLAADGVSLVTLGLSVSLVDLATRPGRKRAAEASYAAAKQRVAHVVTNTALDAEGAWYELVAARQAVALERFTEDAAALSVELSRRFHEAGNLTDRSLALAEAEASEARLGVLASETALASARAELGDLLGLPVNDDWSVPARLPLPIDTVEEEAELIALSRRSRLDLAAATAEVEAATAASRTGRWARWIDGAEVGAEREREGGEALVGPLLHVELPVRAAGDRQRLATEQKLAELERDRLELVIDNAVRAARAKLSLAARQVAEYRDRLVPARQAASAGALEQQNYMLIGVFEALTARRQEYEARRGHLDAARDYWLARTELKRAVGADLPSEARIDGPPLELLPAANAEEHRGHH